MLISRVIFTSLNKYDWLTFFGQNFIGQFFSVNFSIVANESMQNLT